MKTGIIRRVDGLGGIVIPKEIRKSMAIREGEALEIETTREGNIVLSKYIEQADESEQVAPTPKVITLYIDTCNQKAYKTIEELIPIMQENGEITSFDEFLCNNYTASSLMDEFDCGKYDEVKADLLKQYNDSIYQEAKNLIDNLRYTDYIEIEVEI